MAATATAGEGAPGFMGEGIACIRGGRLVFRDLGFRVAPGGVLLVTGPNGSGKSSLLRIMAGLLPPAAGALAWPEGERAPAYLGHADGLKGLATVGESFGYWGALSGPRDPAERARSVTAAIEGFSLAPLVDLPCRHLSQGQRRRVALARVAASPSHLWLLDEPTTSLDASGARAFEVVLARHLEAGGMAVVATHARLGPEGGDILALDRLAGGGPEGDPSMADPVDAALS